MGFWTVKKGFGEIGKKSSRKHRMPMVYQQLERKTKQTRGVCWWSSVKASSMQCIGMVVDARDSKQMLLVAAHASSSRKAPGEESLQRREEEERRRGHGEGERNLMLWRLRGSWWSEREESEKLRQLTRSLKSGRRMQEKTLFSGACCCRRWPTSSDFSSCSSL